jgi:hypothetical protein
MISYLITCTFATVQHAISEYFLLTLKLLRQAGSGDHLVINTALYCCLNVPAQCKHNNVIITFDAITLLT